MIIINYCDVKWGDVKYKLRYKIIIEKLMNKINHLDIY